MNEYNSSDQLNSCKNEESVNLPMRSIGFTDMEIPYASHIMMGMDKLLGSKSNQRKRTSTTKVERQTNYSDNTCSQQVVNE